MLQAATYTGCIRIWPELVGQDVDAAAQLVRDAGCYAEARGAALNALHAGVVPAL